VVNLERMPNASGGVAPDPQSIIASLAQAARSHSRRELNEVRASMAPLMDAFAAARDNTATPPPAAARDPRPLDQSIIGTWRSPIMTVTFSTDGTVEATMFGGQRRKGRWSVERTGRLHSDITGHSGAADAWVVGDQLTINVDGDSLNFTRG
jgi:hypothetical protein